MKIHRFPFARALGLLWMVSSNVLGANTINDSEDIGLNASPATALQLGDVTWNVSEPYINLWVKAEPFGYAPSRGPGVTLDLVYKQRGARPFDDDPSFKPRAFSVGGVWGCSWLSYVAYNDPGATATVYFAGGGSRSFTADGATVDYLTNTKLSRNMSGNTVTSFERLQPSGAREVFGFIVNGTSGKYAFRTSLVDPSGNTLTFQYTTCTDGGGNVNVQLLYVIDPDSNLAVMTYGNSSFPNYITRIDDYFGRHATIQYDVAGKLQSVTDTGNLTTSFGYNGAVLSSFTTCYGTTSFAITDPGGQLVDGRAVQVTEADGNKQLFAYRDGLSSVLPAAYPSGDVPTTSTFANTFDNTVMFDRNSFHWDRLQFTTLSAAYTNSGNIYNLTAADYKIGQLKHWLKDSATVVSGTLSMDRTASANGVADGQKTWYDYTGKPAADTKGTQLLPLFIARVLPGGASSFSRMSRNFWGKATQTDSTYTLADGTVGVRTFTSNYSTDGIDLLEERGPGSQLLHSYTYNSYHQVLTKGDVVDASTTYTTTYSYDSSYRQLTNIVMPSGLSRSYSYNSVRRVSQISDSPINRTESFTYTNGLVRTHTDARGLTLTNTWDTLQRLTKVAYPDGTYLSNSYSRAGTPILDRTLTRDRLGYTNYYAYDNVRQLSSTTDPLNHTNSYTYAGALGQVASIQNPLAQSTSFGRDNNGLVTQTTYACNIPGDSRCMKSCYNCLGQLTDSQNQNGATFQSYAYANQGTVSLVSNPSGPVQSTTYDIYDRPVTIAYSPAPIVNQTFDLLGRVLTRSVVGGGTEAMAYSARGLTNHTDQLGHATSYQRDEAGRLLTVTNPKNEVTHYAYKPTGELQTLTDPKNQVTTWNYDVEGRCTNVVDSSGTTANFTYDANGRMLTRWTPAKGTTSYTYDAVGNLTFINYPSSPDVSRSYDAWNRLTNVTDSVTGTTTFNYTTYGTLQSEDGPWASDTVTYGYDSNRKRSRLDLSQPTGGNWTLTYTNDSSLRLQTIGLPTGLVTYSYLPGSSLISSIALPNGSSIAKSYDGQGRLSVTQLRDSYLNTLDYQGDTRDNANRLTRRTRLNNYVDYGYDLADQLASANGYETGSGAQRRHEWLSYTYDAAGNLTQRNNNALVENFASNGLNEVTNAGSGGTVTVSGMTYGATSVSVNGSSAAPFADGSFAVTGLSLASTYTATAQNAAGQQVSDTVTGLSSSAVNFTYDANGNLTGDGKRAFTYDDENRLTRVEVPGSWRTDFAYDGLGRRRWRREYDGSGTLLQEVRYIFDGNLVIQERDGNNNVLVTYTRGLDLSGTLEGACLSADGQGCCGPADWTSGASGPSLGTASPGPSCCGSSLAGINGAVGPESCCGLPDPASSANVNPTGVPSSNHGCCGAVPWQSTSSLASAGGIGGLLARTDSSGTAYYHADSGGNVTLLVDGSQRVVARYLYDPFGNNLGMGGGLAGVNTYRFSSKEYHERSGLSYFGARFYDSNLQRWLNRDPIRVFADVNLYRVNRNSPLNVIDPNGEMDFAGTIPDFIVGGAKAVGAVAVRAAAVTVAGVLTFLLLEGDLPPKGPCEFYKAWCDWGNGRPPGDKGKGWTPNSPCDDCYTLCKASGNWPFDKCGMPGNGDPKGTGPAWPPGGKFPGGRGPVWPTPGQY